MPGFFERQLHAIRAGGARMLVSKLRRHVPRILGAIVVFVPAVLAVIVARLLRPVLLVRTGRLLAFRIGHFVGNTDVYLCQKEDVGTKSVDLFSIWGPVANRQIERMWRRALHVSWFYGEMHRWNTLLPGADAHIARTDDPSIVVDWTGVTRRHGPHLHFTDNETRDGQARLLAMTGAERPPRFVCIHSRDSAFLKRDSPHVDYSYHDHRDSDIASFLEAASYFTSRGYHVFRMGAVVESALQPTGDARVIDYATQAPSPFMDVYLEANCHLHLGDSTGLNEIPRAFKRPVVVTNVLPVTHAQLHSFAPEVVFIPKRLFSEKLGREWTFREFAEADVRSLAWGEAETYRRLGLTAIDNTAEEIAAVAREADERIAGTWVETPEDRELQDRFWNIVSDNSRDVLGVRIGAWFLRAHPELLD